MSRREEPLRTAAASRARPRPEAALGEASPTSTRQTPDDWPQRKPGIRNQRKPAVDFRVEDDCAQVQDAAASPRKSDEKAALVVGGTGERSPGKRSRESAKNEAAASSKSSAQGSEWAKSDHDGLLTLHDGTKRWYHCELCEYRNDRLYHSKMHFLRIHVKNGKSMPNKRKYSDKTADSGQASTVPAPRAPAQSGSDAQARNAQTPVAIPVSPSGVRGRTTSASPLRPGASPGRSPGKERARVAKQRLDLSSPVGPVNPGRTIRTGRNGSSLKVTERPRYDTADHDDAAWSHQTAHVLTFGGDSIGSGVSFNAREMSSPVSLGVGRTTIGAPAGLRSNKKQINKKQKVKLEEDTAPKHPEASWPQDDPPFEHSDVVMQNGSGTRPVGSPGGKQAVTPQGTPVCSPSRPGLLREMAGIPSTPLTGGDRSLSAMARISASPEKFRSRTPTSNALELGRSPGPGRRRATSHDVEGFLTCTETLDCELSLTRSDLSDLHDFNDSKVPRPHFARAQQRLGCFFTASRPLICACSYAVSCPPLPDACLSMLAHACPVRLSA